MSETREPLDVAKDAIRHALVAIRDDPRKFYLTGPLTGTWEKLTDAAALLFGLEKAEVEKRFQPEPERYNRYCDEVERERWILRACREDDALRARIEELDAAA